MSTRAALASLGVRPRRRLGQNFLSDARVATRIVEAANVRGETVFEIGPGLGALSGALAERAAHLVLVEIDPGLAGALRERFGRQESVTIVEADALTVDWRPLLPPGARAVATRPARERAGYSVMHTNTIGF